jgi:hypothetical protein
LLLDGRSIISTVTLIIYFFFVIDDVPCCPLAAVSRCDHLYTFVFYSIVLDFLNVFLIYETS